MLEREILEQAWCLIERSENWTQGTAARDRGGARVAPDDQDACCWCAIGAVERAVADRGADPALVVDVVEMLCGATKELFGTRFLNHVNDRQDHQAIRRLFARALAHCERAEPKGNAEAQQPEMAPLLAMLGYCLHYIDQLERQAHA